MPLDYSLPGRGNQPVPVALLAVGVGVGLLLVEGSVAPSSPDVRLAKWRETFHSDVVLGLPLYTLQASNSRACARECRQWPDCLCFAFSAETGSCLLYDHRVEFGTTGRAGVGMRYYWLLAARCPTEKGYVQVAGLCIKRYSDYVNYTTAQQVCREDSAHLLIADTRKKLNMARTKLQLTLAWLGLSEIEKEGEWWWLEGSFLPTDSSLWLPNEPNNVDGIESVAADWGEGFVDVPLSFNAPLICQIPV